MNTPVTEICDRTAQAQGDSMDFMRETEGLS